MTEIDEHMTGYSTSQVLSVDFRQMILKRYEDIEQYQSLRQSRHHYEQETKPPMSETDDMSTLVGKEPQPNQHHKLLNMKCNHLARNAS
ncbi:hypothetical protein OUZ56_025497 [Daphnia magna]|uniref:Uncharacterized protein n=1 Tax=Daphnia magna TaxID=35525 RepID=A0ABQ9ZK14_9CRUS|nr:hypothetical protein OUZ56_025497 [Daphnia magna]